MLPNLPTVRRVIGATSLVFGMTASLHLTAAETIDLSGEWRQQLDPADAGRAERWFTRTLTHSMRLPGSLQQNRIGEKIRVDTKWTGGIFDRSYFTAPEYAPYREPDNIKVPFWLQPETHYVGASWFQRDLEIPSGWQGRNLVLTLERPHWKTSVWIDDREIGSKDANSVAHRYDLGTGISPGRHVLTVRVDNALNPDIGENSHSISDHTQGNWNGIVGRIELSATAPVWIDDVQVYPRLEDRTILVKGQLARAAGQPWAKTVRIASETASQPSIEVPVAVDGTFSAEYPFRPNAASWDEFNPALHRVVVTLDNGERGEVAFGFRSVATEGRRLQINGRPLFLRGALDCAAFPRTGNPPTDVGEWKRILGIIRSHGLNHVRYHSWCPPEAAFIAADELGMYLQVEVATWPNWSTTLGDGKPVDGWVDAETQRILRAYGNHPSFIMLCAGNEPGGDGHVAWLTKWVARQKATDTRRLYTAGAGWPETPGNQFHVRSEPRIHQWLDDLRSRINARPPETRSDYSDFILERSVPVISHEIGQWCVFPNFAEMAKYTGYLKPKNYEIFRETLEAHGLGAQAHDFLIASGKLQALCYKEEIEAALRTRDMAGFQLLGLADFPGQGTALVGVLDAFWEEKGYITPAEFRRFCAPTVPLARLAKRVFTADENLQAELEVAHFGAETLRAAASWKLVSDDGRAAASGRFQPRDFSVSGAQGLGRIDIALQDVPVPARYKLVVALDGTGFENDWDVWVYPAVRNVVTQPSSDLLIASAFDSATRAKLDAGGTVVLMIPPEKVAPDPKRGRIALGFSSIFWNTAWTNGQAPHTLGILCDPKHPALALFPTDAHSNWQWWYPVSDAGAMILDGLPRELKPTVQVVDDWFTSRKLGLVFEARVGKGRVLVTSIDLRGAVLDPVRRQLRASLLSYAASAQFDPKTSVSAEAIAALIKP